MIEIIAMLVALGLPSLDRGEIHCLATTIYHEARGEPLVGQVAVGNVIMNRAAATGRRICSIVHEPDQFTADGPITEPDAWRRAAEVATLVYAGEIDDQTNGAVHFYDHRKVNPRWTTCCEVTRTISGHRFLTVSARRRG